MTEHQAIHVMQQAEWAMGKSEPMHAVCVKNENSIRISIAPSQSNATKGIDSPNAYGLPTPTNQQLARPLNTSIEHQQDTEYALSIAGKLAKRCQKPVYVHYESGDMPTGELCDDAFLTAIKMIITHFNL